jgi:hypothetical protein
MADRSSKSAIVSYETDLIALHHQPELSDPDGSSALGIETVERVDLCFNVLDSLIPKVGQYGVSTSPWVPLHNIKPRLP